MFILDNWEECKNQTYNLGNDELNMNKLQLAEKIQQHLPLEIIRAEINSDPDTRDYIVSSDKIYNKGYECAYDLDDGIRQLITAYAIIESPWYANYLRYETTRRIVRASQRCTDNLPRTEQQLLCHRASHLGWASGQERTQERLFCPNSRLRKQNASAPKNLPSA